MNRYPTYENVEYDEADSSEEEEEEEAEITDYLYYQPYTGQQQGGYPQPIAAQPSGGFTRYQPGQALEPIHTGETLHLNRDSQNTGGQYYSDQDYLPPSIPPSLYTGSSSNSHDDHDVDHFNYDPEAYASGYNSQWRQFAPPPRSRSPTPAVDDEDYLVVGDRSFHYTGESPEKDRETLHQYEAPDEPFWPPGMAKRGSFTSQSDADAHTEHLHFGGAPVGRTERRHMKKRVKLVNGNLVTESKVPAMLVLPRRATEETGQTQYSAIFCDPDEFPSKQYPLRQLKYKRMTEIFVVITMYNEDEILFCRTLYGVMRNIAQLCSRKNSRTWGKNGWEKVVVCIVSDGRKKIHPRVLDCLTLLGVYQDPQKVREQVGFHSGSPTAHLYEYTTTFGLDANLHFKYPDKGVVPTQIMFLLKEKNQKKINSHRWFFNAFGPMLQPKVCILLDVGTCPGNNSFYKLWKTFDLNSNVGGACGEIAAYTGKWGRLLVNPLVASQNFEYKISGILDKPTESMFGYISVLPGAFSAYRYIALQNDEHGVGPLASYFKGEVLHGRDTDIFTSNMYLAEDRILCFELIAKKNSDWVLRYVRGAVGETDVPDALPEFIAQRRRWLNGSFFAATYAIAHTPQLWRSGHSFSRKFMLTVETVYNIMNLCFAWFSIGNFYLFFVVLTSSLEDAAFGLWGGIKFVNWSSQYILAALIISLFFMSMSINPRRAHAKYKLISVMLSVLMVYMLAATVVSAVKASSEGGAANSIMLFSVIITFGVYLVSSCIAMDPAHMLTSFLPYLLLSPTYINILNIYAYSNIDDISWGTKQDLDEQEPEVADVVLRGRDQNNIVEVSEATPEEKNDMYDEAIHNLKNRIPIPKPPTRDPTDAEREQEAKEYYASVRTHVLLTWVLTNGILLALILGSGSNTTDTFTRQTRAKTYLVFILAFTALSNIIRFLASTIYLLMTLITG